MRTGVARLDLVFLGVLYQALHPGVLSQFSVGNDAALVPLTGIGVCAGAYAFWSTGGRELPEPQPRGTLAD
jgi:hypothetical protein